jgi:hypothetical protein
MAIREDRGPRELQRKEIKEEKRDKRRRERQAASLKNPVGYKQYRPLGKLLETGDPSPRLVLY